MGETMQILVTNDDGVNAEGLLALIRELEAVAEVVVVAPDRERSAIGHSLTFFHPLRVQKIRENSGCTIFSTNGTPSDCVILALFELMDKKPDLIVSGINRGPNLGDDISYSGTVSAVLEGMLHGIPGFAVSLAAYDHCDYSFAAKFARKLLLCLQSNSLPPRTFLNVNVPNIREDEIAGVAITRQGSTTYRQRLDRRVDPRGHPYYWIGGTIPEGDLEEGTDFLAIARKQISITPVHRDFTNREAVKELSSWKALLEREL